MEILAENRVKITKQAFYEGMRRLQRDSYGSFAVKVSAGLAALWVLLLLVTVFTRGSLAYALGELAVLALVCLWLWVLLPRSKIRQAYRRMEAKHGGQMERVTRFYADRVEILAGDTVTSIPYEDVVSIAETKHLLLLSTAGGTAVMLDKAGFCIGDGALAEQIIQKKQTEGVKRD